ncbi:hypothetical protein B5F82_05125 [Megamonas hypermegale]|uniref:DUF6630 domain-containing protein n=1 Tax=Megamonas hypermegale TaxID=158847 RepID=A0A239T8N1_9FIRM|nr:DUF6630 family protein [Megamonas hypermegale]MBM6760678.1 hypothetical protein [Megamonas hypermegale]MBM6833040.1 hypothetical protein [Megamonas hypermegale]OUO40290.1 hypothetical protein B5F82_05125 [Megamonas hypermegale]SNU94097.1 Uncharacterised protein [Megamonas hypermegale]HJG08053.1 hypothetical protein [Megamonas hypermegale]
MEREEVLLKIAQLISNNDSDVIIEVEECIDDIQKYVATHLEEYEDRSMTLEDDSEEDLQWLGMVNCLIRNNYVYETDDNVQITEFGWELKNLCGFKEYGLSLDSKFLDVDYGVDRYDINEDDEDVFDYDEEEDFIEDDNIIGWCKYLDNKWADENVCIGMININSDSYIIFPIDCDVLEELEDLADSIDRHISSVY